MGDSTDQNCNKKSTQTKADVLFQKEGVKKTTISILHSMLNEFEVCWSTRHEARVCKAASCHAEPSSLSHGVHGESTEQAVSPFNKEVFFLRPSCTTPAVAILCMARREVQANYDPWRLAVLSFAGGGLQHGGFLLGHARARRRALRSGASSLE